MLPGGENQQDEKLPEITMIDTSLSFSDTINFFMKYEMLDAMRRGKIMATEKQQSCFCEYSKFCFEF